MRGLRAALTILAVALLTPAPAALGQAATSARPGVDDAGIPRRPIPYAQLARPSRSPSRPAAKTLAPKAQPRPAAKTPAARVTAASTRPTPVPTAQQAPSGAAPPAGPATPVNGATLLGPTAAPSPARNGARLAAGEAIAPAELEAFVDGALRQAMADHHIAGVTVAVVQNGQLLLAKGYGDAVIADGGRPSRPVDPRTTLFRLGGASRLLTALATLKAAEQGRLKLDQPVNYLLPPALRIADDDVKRPILVRHLLTQTAGFEARTLGRLYTTDPARLLAPEAALTRRPPRRVFAPGEVASESAYGTALLGAALSNIARRPFDDLIETELTGPLRMARTTFREPYPARAGIAAPMRPELARDRAQDYRWTSRGYAPAPAAFAQSYAPAEAASSAAVDMARLMAALLNGGALDGVQVFGPGVVQLLRTPIQRTPLGVNGWPGGLVASVLPGGWRTLGYAGATPASHAALTLAPDLKLGVFVAANTDTARAAVGGLAALIAERFYAPPRAGLRHGDQALARNASAFAGRYVSSARALHGLERVVDRLTRAAEVRVGADGRLLTRVDGRVRLWAPEFPGLGDTPTRFRAADGDESLVFSLRGRRAAGFTPADNMASYTRVSWFLDPRLLFLGALAVAIASGLTILGLFLRAGRELRRTDAQAIGGALQAVAAGLWLAAMACFLAWTRTVRDPTNLVAHWPDGWVVAASSLALAAFVGSLLLVVQLLEIWRSDRRGSGWTRGRRLRHSITAAVFVAYGLLLTLWGALTPWAP